jgi:UDP-N-acetylglucosamine/UDP-N-acetylgalactosamine 4-epimerase
MKILVTGGAGFIGSNLVKTLINRSDVEKVRILDDLSTGYLHNIENLLDHPKVSFIKGDIRDFNTCVEACEGMTVISHQAALGSVPRSIQDPVASNAVNVSGTLNVFNAARLAGIKRVVYASSSSVYGDNPTLPKKEENLGKPLSPYAVTKLVAEQYADVFAKLYGLEMIGLRYFNVFGPNQSPEGAYAAVIPLFMKAIVEGKSPIINGDGSQTRDFTYIDNVVDANIKALFTTSQQALNQNYNVACGSQTSLLALFESIKKEAKSSLMPIFGKPRVGDIPHSLADISKIEQLLGYSPKVTVLEGIKQTFQWFTNKVESSQS